MAHVSPPIEPAGLRHSVVYRRDDAFCGWPFYCGLWRVADGTLVAGFKRIAASYGTAADVNHEKLTFGEGELVLIRSTDDGATWNGEALQPVHRLATTAADIPGPRDYAAEGPLDPSSPNTLFMSGAVPAFLKPNSEAWLRASADGGRTWRRPILLPMGGFAALSGCGSTIARSDGLFLTGLALTTEGGWMNRPLLYASRDGVTWRFLSFITPEGAQGAAASTREGNFIFGAIGEFYPRLVETRSGRLLASVRYQREAREVIWTDIHASDDGGLTWRHLSRVNEWGAPGDLVVLSDGRIVCVYGYRVPPYGIRARVSADEGATWGRELILRADGGSWDLGYPRAIELAPGRVLAVYYMNLAADPRQQNGGVRHIAQTIFDPEP